MDRYAAPKVSARPLQRNDAQEHPGGLYLEKKDQEREHALIHGWPRVSKVRSFAEDAAELGPLAPHTVGLRTVPVRKIVGSVGRASELRSNFMPLHGRKEGPPRYQRIVQALEAGVIMPPVDLYKLGHSYYALDGNHRVAAALERGQLDIDAFVVEFVPMEDRVAQQTFRERRSFEYLTGLQDVEASRPCTYPRLEICVRLHALERGMDLREGARHWYHRVYLPAVATLPEETLRERFPDMDMGDWFIHVDDERISTKRVLGYAGSQVRAPASASCSAAA